MTGWQAGLLSVGFIVGTIIQGLIVLNNPTYVFERWHGTLLVWAITAFCVIFNTVLAKRLPAVEGVVLTIHIMGLFAVIVPLWILSPRATSNEALLTFTNGGGWPTTGLSAMIGLLTPMGSLCGFDCAVHMCQYAITVSPQSEADVGCSGRGRGCQQNPPKINHVVSLSQRSNGLYHGHHYVLLSWGSYGDCRYPDWVSIHSGVLQCHKQLRCRQYHDGHYDRHAYSLLH